MKHPSLLAAALLVAWSPLGAVQGSGADTVVAELEWEAGLLAGSAPRLVSLRREPPSGAQLPSDLEGALFAELELADGWLTLALDPDPESPRLWVDQDLDGDLAEERSTALSREGSAFTRSQVVQVPYDGEEGALPLELQWILAVGGAQPRLSVQLAMYRRGTVVLAGRLRPVAVVDGDSDGRFDDPETDRIYVDCDGNGQLQVGGDLDERVAPGQPFRLVDEGWTARVSTPSGRTLTFERVASAPPPVVRSWPEGPPRPTPGVARTPPSDSLEALLERFAAEASEPVQQRLHTLTLIGDVGTPEAFDALLRIADAEEDPLGDAALRALGNPAFLAERGKRLAGLARKAEREDAHALSQALFMAGHPERDAIYVDLLRSSDPTVVGAAARWLAWSDTEAATEAIVAAVEGSRSPEVRHSAYVYGARGLRDGPPIETVLRAARDSYAPLRAEAIGDLGLIGHPQALPLALAEAEERPVLPGTGRVVCGILGAAGTPEAVAALLGLLEVRDLPATVHKEAVDQLRLVRSGSSVAVLTKALDSKEPSVRAAVAEVLSGWAEPAVTEALLKRARKERDEEVLPVLLEALGDHGDPEAVEVLEKHARSREPAVRTAAIRGLARIGFDHDEVRAFFLSLLDSREWVDRVLALDAAQAAGDRKLVPDVVDSLDHPQWQVRLAAVEALAALRPREAALPLIDRLEVEPERRIRDAIGRALLGLTGVYAGTSVDAWRRWWADHGETFSVPDQPPVPHEPTAGRSVASFYGLPLDSERVVFLIDQSGSMSALAEQSETTERLDRLDVAVRETLGALAGLDDKAQVNVILFHSTVHPWEDELQRLGPKRQDLERTLRSKTPMGGTNIYDALELALRMEGVDTIFLLSDGSPGQGKYVATDDILRAVKRENQTRRIAIHCVAVGMDSKLLRELAAQNGGRYVQR